MSKRPPAPATTTEGMPPLADAVYWQDVIDSGSLASKNAGALLSLYDEGTGDKLARTILTHVLLEARLILERTVPSDIGNRADVIDDALGLVGAAAADPKGKPALRGFFVNFVYLRGKDAVRDGRKLQGAAEIDDGMGTALHPDPEGAMVARLDLRKILAGLKNSDHRLALVMSAAGAKPKEIAKAVRRTPDTVTVWINAIRPTSPRDSRRS